MKTKIPQIVKIVLLILVIVAVSWLVYRALHQSRLANDEREDELRRLEASSQPITQTPEERGEELKLLEGKSVKPKASVEDRKAELERLSQ